MEELTLKKGDIYELKKPHPCGANRWETIGVGMDVKLKCLGCGHIVTISRQDAKKRIKKSL